MKTRQQQDTENNLQDEITKPKEGDLINTFISYKPFIPNITGFNINESTEGETIERRCERIMNNNEPISDIAPQIFTDRGDGVIPECNPRTDRFDYALDATDQITKNRLTQRQQRAEERTKANNPPDDNTPPKSEPTPTKTDK